MTLAEAYAQLKAQWPNRSFKVGFEAWHHDHGPRPPLEMVEWSIWDDEAGVHRKSPTLEGAMALALPQTPDLAAVERQIVDMETVAGWAGYRP
jgi:hypothetical protein